MEPTKDKIFVEHSPDATTVTLMDEKLLDAQDIQELQEALMSVVKQARREKLILDFANVQFLSYVVLGLLVKVHKNIPETKTKNIRLETDLNPFLRDKIISTKYRNVVEK